MYLLSICRWSLMRKKLWQWGNSTLTIAKTQNDFQVNIFLAKMIFKSIYFWPIHCFLFGHFGPKMACPYDHKFGSHTWCYKPHSSDPPSSAIHMLLKIHVCPPHPSPPPPPPPPQVLKDNVKSRREIDLHWRASGWVHLDFWIFYIFTFKFVFCIGLQNEQLTCSDASTLSTSATCSRTPTRVRNASSSSWSGEWVWMWTCFMWMICQTRSGMGTL